MARRSWRGWRGGGGVARAAGRTRWWGYRSPQWGQWVRRCAATRQTQWYGLQGRAVCGSRWRTQRGMRGLAVGGTCGQTLAWRTGACGARMLVGMCAVLVVLVCAVPVL